VDALPWFPVGFSSLLSPVGELFNETCEVAAGKEQTEQNWKWLCVWKREGDSRSEIYSLHVISLLASKTSPLPERPELIIGSFSSLLLIINKWAVIQVLMEEMLSLTQWSSQPVFQAVSESCWHEVSALSAASLPIDNVVDLIAEHFFVARASCAWDGVGFQLICSSLLVGCVWSCWMKLTDCS